MAENFLFLEGGIVIGFTQGWELSLVLMGSLPILAGAGAWMAINLSTLTTLGEKSYRGAGGVAEQVRSACVSLRLMPCSYAICSSLHAFQLSTMACVAFTFASLSVRACVCWHVLARWLEERALLVRPKSLLIHTLHVQTCVCILHSQDLHIYIRKHTCMFLSSSKRAQKPWEVQQEIRRNSRSDIHTKQALSGIRTVQSLSGQQREKERYAVKLREALQTGLRKARINGTGFGVVMGSFIGTYALGLWFGSWLIINERTNTVTGKPFTGGDVILCFFAIVMGSFSIGQVGPAVQAFAKGQSSAARIYDVIDRCIRICVCICIYIYTHTHIYVCTYMYSLFLAVMMAVFRCVVRAAPEL